MALGANLRQKWVFWLVVVLFCGCYLVRGMQAAQENTNSSAFDQRSYLGLALNIHDGRDMSDGKRHPLLPAILSPMAERDWPFYVKAKYLNLLIGACAIALSYEIGRRWYNAWVGLAVAGLLSLNPPFLHVASHVMAEPLLLCLTLIAWYLMTRALRAPPSTAWRFALGAGLATGLAYLTKGTALQMVPAFLVSALLIHGKRFWRRREVWLFPAAWLLAWLPLLLFNVSEYGNPLYNYNYKHEIFLDSPTDRHFADVSEAPTLQTYLAEHTAADIAYRMWFGLREVTRILFRALAPVDPESVRGAAELAWIAAWLALAGLLLRGRSRYAARVAPIAPAYLLLAMMLGASMVPLGWFVQASNVGPRFIVVFHPMIYLVALGTLDMWLRGAPEESAPAQGSTATRRLDGYWAVAVAALACVSMATALRALPLISRHPVAAEREANARPQAVLAWLEEGTPYGTRVLWGPSYTLPNWIYERRLSLKDVPSKVETWDDIVAYARDRELSYALLDWEMVSRREKAFARHVVVDYPYLRITSFPPDWALVLPYDGFPSNWLVWRTFDSVPLAEPRSVVLDEQVTYLGAEIYPEQPAAGGVLYVTLYWQALSTSGQDYSVFVHLIDQAGNVVAQADGWPLEGRYPTSLWQAGQLVGDRHQLDVPDSTAPGAYQVVAGMYRLDTMQRLPVVLDDGASAQDGQFAVTHVQLLEPGAYVEP